MYKTLHYCLGHTEQLTKSYFKAFLQKNVYISDLNEYPDIRVPEP